MTLSATWLFAEEPALEAPDSGSNSHKNLTVHVNITKQGQAAETNEEQSAEGQGDAGVFFYRGGIVLMGPSRERKKK